MEGPTRRITNPPVGLNYTLAQLKQSLHLPRDNVVLTDSVNRMAECRVHASLKSANLVNVLQLVTEAALDPIFHLAVRYVPLASWQWQFASINL